MKTSFYFVLWIVIYPILGLFHNSFINENAFIVALAVVWGLSWLLKRIMPDTLAYERASQIAPILEDVYTGNVSSFRKRLSTYANIEIITAIYFVITTIVIALVIFIVGVNDWMALIIFIFFTFGAISKSYNLIKAQIQLKNNPTSEQCMEIAGDTYKLDYPAYYDIRSSSTYEGTLPPKPRFFGIFNIFSTLIAAIAALLGLGYIIFGILIMFSETSIRFGAVAGMYFLYGALAAYFGIKDFISCIHSKRYK